MYKDFQTYYLNQVDYYLIKPKIKLILHISYETYITKSYNVDYLLGKNPTSVQNPITLA